MWQIGAAWNASVVCDADDLCANGKCVPDEPTSPIEPGQVYKYKIDLWATSNLFRKGHQIRLEISSSNFPRFDRNTNTGEPIGTDTRFVSALQTVLHNPEYPSHITLPIIPRE